MEQPTRVPLSDLQPGEFFDDAGPTEASTREGVFRVYTVRNRTVLADNVLGMRFSFSRKRPIVRATKELFDTLAAAPPTPRPVRAAPVVTAAASTMTDTRPAGDRKHARR